MKTVNEKAAKEVLVFFGTLFVVLILFSFKWHYKNEKENSFSKNPKYNSFVIFGKDSLLKMNIASNSEVSKKKEKLLYDAISDIKWEPTFDEYGVPIKEQKVSFSEFKANMQVDWQRRKLYYEYKDIFELGSFDEFENKVGYKNKETESEKQIALAYINFWEQITAINKSDYICSLLIYVILILAYPLRFSLRAILWAIKTLKQKPNKPISQ